MRPFEEILAPATALAVADLLKAVCPGLGGSLAYQDFKGKNLQQVKLYKADLRGTDFTSANLTGANLFGAFAKDAHFVGANLRLAVLESVDFDNAGIAVLLCAECDPLCFVYTDCLLLCHRSAECNTGRGTGGYKQAYSPVPCIER